MVCDRQDADAAGPRAGERRGGGAAEFGRVGARNGAAGTRSGAAPYAECEGRARLQGGGALQLSERNARTAARPQGRHAPLLRLSRDEGPRGAGGRRRDGRALFEAHRQGKTPDRKQRRTISLRLLRAADRQGPAPPRGDRRPRDGAGRTRARGRAGGIQHPNERAAQGDDGLVPLLLPARRRGVRAAGK